MASPVSRPGARVFVGGLGALAAGALFACGAFGSATQDAAGGADGSAGDAAAALDGHEPDASTSTRGDSGCPGSAGPYGVRVGSFCIDATEVTRSDYAAFAAAASGTTLDAGARCGPVPISALAPDDAGTLPMTDVTFCEARAYCSWAGKQLCGLIDGGAAAHAQLATQDGAWFHACTGGTADVVHLVSDGGCNVDAIGLHAAGSSCQGGVAGLFDMVGSVWEWVESTDSPAAPLAWLQGGSWGSPSTVTCSTISSALIDSRGFDVGFRCCAP